jgi:hypothetical protein
VTFTAPHANSVFQASVAFAFGYTQDSDPATYVWTEVSQYLRAAGGPITITKGKAYTPGQISAASPCQVAFTLSNNAGWFTADNPLSPFYPNVVIGTPVRVTLTWPGAVTSYERIVAFVTGWPIVPNAGMIDVVCPIVAQGRLRRLNRPGKPVASTLTRAISQTAPIAWWPMEDGPNAIRAASAVAGGAALVPASSGAVNYARATAPARFAQGGAAGGTAPLPDFSAGGTLRATVPLSTATSWRVEFVAKWAEFTGGTYTAAAQFNTLSDAGLFEVDATSLSLGGLYIQYYGGGGGLFTSNVACDDGQYHHVRVDGAKSGGNISLTVSLDGTVVITQTLAGLAWGCVNTVAVNPLSFYSTVSQTSLGELAVWAPWSASVDTVAASRGYPGELADARVTRVCLQQNIPVVVTSATTPAQPMGPQGIDTVLNILSAVEQVDCGFLHDGGPLGKLAYVTQAVRYNAAAAFTLDYKRGQIGDDFAGGITDTQIANDWQVTAADGSTVERADTESVTAVGEFDQAASTLAVDATQGLQLAGWKAHLGGYRSALFPSVQVDLRRSPELAEAITNLTLPAHIGMANLPTPWYPPINLDQFAEGYTETIDAVTWQIVFNTSPFPPYQVIVLDDVTLGKLDLEQTTLSGAKTAVAVGTVESWSIATVVGLLSTAGGDYPVDWVCDGERVTVTAVTGGASPQTATVKRGQNGITRAHANGATIRLWIRPVLAL